MQNRLKTIRNKREMTLAEVATKIGKSVAYVEGIENGQNKLTEAVFFNLCGLYKVMGDEVFGLKLGGINKAKCDDVLVDCCIWFLLDAATKRRAGWSKKQLSKWVTFLHDAAIGCSLNATQMRSMATVIAKREFT